MERQRLKMDGKRERETIVPGIQTKKDGEIENLVDSSDQLQVKALSKSVIKYYICFPKVLLDI